MGKLKKDDIVIEADRDDEDMANNDLTKDDLVNEDVSSLLLSYLGAMVDDDNEAIEDFSHVILLLDHLKGKGHFRDSSSFALSQGIDSLHNLCGARIILREKLRSVLDALSSILSTTHR